MASSGHHCSICLEDFKEPKILPCVHTFCLKCLEDHVSVHQHMNKFRCPICREETEIPKEGPKGFKANIYVVDSADRQLCTKHSGTELKFYCRDCSVPICLYCNVVSHENHKKDDLADFGIQAREELKSAKQAIEETKEEIESFCNSLKDQITHIKAASSKARSNVDSQVRKICNAVQKEGEAVKLEIITTEDDEIKKLDQLLEKTNALKDELQSHVQSTDDVLAREATIPVLDILPKMKALVTDKASTKPDFPVIKSPDFPSTEIDLEVLKRQLGAMEVVNAPVTFQTTLNVSGITDTGAYLYGREVLIHGMPWRIAVEKNADKTKLGLFLTLRQSEDASPCDVSFALNLLNKMDDNRSVKLAAKNTFKPKENRWGWYYPEWSHFSDKQNNFLDDGGNFTIDASVTIIGTPAEE